MPSMLPWPVSRLRAYMRATRAVAGQTRDQVYETRAALQAQVNGLDDRLRAIEALGERQLNGLDQLSGEMAACTTQLQEAGVLQAGRHQQLVEAMRFVHDRGSVSRRQLRELRNDPAYESAYVEPSPLVSVVIPTYTNHRLLRERAIPSVLNQTYPNFEIVVVGDAAPDEARIAVESFADPRISYTNLPYRGPYPTDPDARWLVAGVPPYNKAVQHSRGLWIAPLDDDDAFTPTHLERLLELARAERHELAYSKIEMRLPAGGTTTLGRFPPEHGQFGLQSSLYHAGLASIFELELADAALGVPYDWAVCLRMMRAGVRMGMLAAATVDYFPSRLWTDRPPAADSEPQRLEESKGATPIEAPLPEWEYAPEGWRASPDDASETRSGWAAADVARAYAGKWPEFLAVTAGADPLGVNHEVPIGEPMRRDDITAQNALLALANVVARAAGPQRHSVSILDWGGALGHHHRLLSRLLPELTLDYHCRELPQVCAEGRRLSPEVTFYDDDACLSDRYDLVMASSSIQYERDWRGRVATLANASRDWTFITRVPLTATHSSFVLRQRAHEYGYGTEYLGWVLNRDELLGVAAAAGLTVDREFVLLPEWHVPDAPAVITHGGFLFDARAVRR